MVGQFGSREICDVTFKALNGMTIGSKTFKAGQPVFVIDTATASNMEQGTTTVYAQGGRGYNRLIAWEGEKTMTFTVTDALMSPIGLKVLSGAGFATDDAEKHVHVTFDVKAAVEVANGNDVTEKTSYASAKLNHDKLAAELGILVDKDIKICVDQNIDTYATILDNFGGIKDWADSVDFVDEVPNSVIILSKGNDKELKIWLDGAVDKYEVGDSFTAKLDFYVLMNEGASQLTIGPGDFGGNFYVEADTLYRNRAGKDMAATLTFPNVKIQSGFTINMSANGDPSTFDFVMDAFPGTTYFDTTNKVVCDIVIVSGDDSESEGTAHDNTNKHPVIAFSSAEPKDKDASMTITISGVGSTDSVAATVGTAAATVTKSGAKYTISKSSGTFNANEKIVVTVTDADNAVLSTKEYTVAAAPTA